MGAIQAFDFESAPVRVIERGGETWFVLADVFKAIGMQNPAHYAAKLADDERGIYDPATGAIELGGYNSLLHPPEDNPKAGLQRVVVSEGGLWTTILRSQAAMQPGTKAYKFRRFVTGELLPTVRKTGRYGAIRDERLLIALRAEVAKWTSRLRQTSNREERRVVHALLAQGCAKLGIPVPQLDGLGCDEPQQADVVDAFWQAVALVDAAGKLRNHSIPSGLIALSMKDVQAAFDAMKIKIRIDKNLRAALYSSIRPRFVAYKTVRSGITSSAIHCMVFEAAGLPAPAVPAGMLL